MPTSARTHIGLVRKNNEDYYVADDNLHLYAVADGIGGHADGQIASKIALETLTKHFKSSIHNASPMDLLLVGFNKANEEVRLYKKKHLPPEDLMGTTLTVAFIHEKKLHVGHIGDSRAYLLRHEMLPIQITQDHTYLAELARHDQKTFLQLKDEDISDKKNYLLKAIGPDKIIEPQIITEELKSNDILLLMTDGMYQSISPSEIKDVVCQASNLDYATEKLEKMALERGGKDNITIIIHRYLKGGEHGE